LSKSTVSVLLRFCCHAKLIAETGKVSEPMMKHFITAMMCMFFGSAYVLAGDAEETQMLETKRCVACDLNNAWFESVALRKADFSGANLYRANLEYADLRGANFTGANLSNARLRGANLTGAIFDGATLKYTNFGEANLSNASFVDAKMRSARFHNTNTDGIRF